VALSGCAGLLPAPEPPLHCAARSALRVRGWPEGGGEWCTTLGGVRAGAARLRLRGFRVDGQYRDDHPAGRWKVWWPGGRPAAELDFDGGTPHGRLLAWYDNGRTLASGAFAAGRVSTPVVFFDARGRARYRLEPEAAGVMDGHAFDERGAEIAPGEEWLPATLPQAYDLLMLGITLSGLTGR
jgi:hypothetical protein